MSKHSEHLPDFDSLWDFSNPAKTCELFDDLIPLAKESGNQDYFLQLLTQIARTQGLQKDFDEAHLTLDEVQEDLTAETPVAKIRYFLERGRVFNSSKEAANALVMFRRAFELAVEAKEDNLAVDAAHMMAIAESSQDSKMEWNLKALSLAERSQDPKAQAWLGSLYNNIGWTYHDSKKYVEALELFEKALAFRQSRGQTANIRIAKWCVARTYRSMQKFSEALQIQMDLKGEFEAAGEKDVYVFEELGELSLALGKIEDSKEFFRLAYNLFSKDEWFKTNEPARFKRVHELSLKR
ncbi:tetratricopeptide repeat protein [Bdellovibrio sp. HCB2-146]|uniref:tetratricopeptide repeat protein n=1 Tax=Bdellovibrio sp. HCB2-146 TaxID=3394362 RepID=UPI0039BCECBA